MSRRAERAEWDRLTRRVMRVLLDVGSELENARQEQEYRERARAGEAEPLDRHVAEDEAMAHRMERQRNARIEREKLVAKMKADPFNRLPQSERMALEATPAGRELIDRLRDGEDVRGEIDEYLELREELGIR